MEIPEDIKKILIAVDQLLESLPEDELDKFINSPEFPIYKRIMNDIYGTLPDDDESMGEVPADQPELSWDKTQEQSPPQVETVRVIPQQTASAQPEQTQREFSPQPFQLKQPIERLKNPNFNFERDVEEMKNPVEIETAPVVHDVEGSYGSRFEQEQQSKEQEELQEFSQFLRNRKPVSREPESEEERKLVEYINQQIEKGFREPDVRGALAKVGWPLEKLDRAFEIAKSIRINNGKQQVRKVGVEFM